MPEEHNSEDQLNTPHLTGGSKHTGNSNNDSATAPLTLSKYTKALLTSWKRGDTDRLASPNRISVSQTVSFAAFLYEKLRNAVEFKEEHLIKRAAIERIIKRRLLLNDNGRDIAEPLIKELLWARYYENNTVGEEKVSEIQAIIDKYFFLRNELSAGRSGGEQERIASFMLDVLSCEIEENLSPQPRRDAIVNYVYQIIRTQFSPSSWDNELERDIQVYIAVERTFSHSDTPVIRYHLLKLMLPEVTLISWRSAEKTLPKLYEVYNDIEKEISHPLDDKMRNAVKKHIAPYLILRDMFEQNPHSMEEIVSDENKLKFKVDDACRKRYDESRSRLRRLALRSFIYILLTKVVFAFIIEVPYDMYVTHEVSVLPLAINIIFPPIFMTLIIITTSVPGDDNTRRIFQLLKGIVTFDPDEKGPVSRTIKVGQKAKVRSIFFSTIFSLLYILMYLVTFGGIIYVLSLLHFNPVSQLIFIFFLTLVTFFAFRVIQITQEYRVVIQESLLSPVTDFFFLPIMRVGQWLSGEVLQRFNFLIFIFDFVIEMPFKAIVEVIDEWVRFVRLKKEEIV
jgi:hypothetical protein